MTKLIESRPSQGGGSGSGHVNDVVVRQMRSKYVLCGVLLVAILLTGTIGYWLIGGRQDSLLDTLYMTIITISTIGYDEIIDLSDRPAGRVFTVFIAVSGIGVLFYILTNLTTFAVEGELTRSFRRRRMERKAEGLVDHYIVCGIGEVGLHVVDELRATKRPYVLVDAIP